MAVTIKDIAKAAGVSYTTVSRSLSNHPDINIRTKENVLAIAKEMGYVPNAIARSLVMKNTYMLGLLVSDITNPYYPEVAKGVEDYANERGYNVFLCNTNEDEQKEKQYLQILRERRVDGIIISPVSEVLPSIVKDLKIDIPIVFIDSRIEEGDLSFVVLDDFKASYMATEHLIKLGHRDIIFVGCDDNTTSYIDRAEGYKKALEKHNLKPEIKLMEDSRFKRKSAYNRMTEILTKERIPKAIVAENDIIALGVIEAAEMNGYNVPGDISVIGIDDIEFASLPKTNLTTVSRPKNKLGEMAVEILIRKINGDKKKYAIILEPTLVVRGTCREL